MIVVVPGVDVGAVEVEVAGVDAGVGVARPVVAVGTAIVEVTVVPVEVPAPEEGESADKVGKKDNLENLQFVNCKQTEL